MNPVTSVVNPPAPRAELDNSRLYAAVITVIILVCVTALLIAHTFESAELNGALVGLYLSALTWWAKSPAS